MTARYPLPDSVRDSLRADPYRGHMRSTGLLTSAAAVLVAVLALLASGSDPAAADTEFGLDPVAESALGGSSVVGVRVGQSEGFDRLSIDFDGEVSGYSVSYVPQVLEVGSGEPVPVEGVAFIQIDLINVPDDPEAPQGTVTPALPGVRQLVGAGAGTDAVARYGIGTAEAAGFRVTTLTDPNRLIIDIAHPGTLPAATPTVDPSATAEVLPTTSGPDLTLSAEELADEPESPNEWLIYPAGGLAAIAVVAALVGWLRRRRTH